MSNWLQDFLGYVEGLHFLPLIYMNKLIHSASLGIGGVFNLPSNLSRSGFKYQLMHYFDALGYWMEDMCISILVAVFMNGQEWHLAILFATL